MLAIVCAASSNLLGPLLFTWNPFLSLHSRLMFSLSLALKCPLLRKTAESKTGFSQFSSSLPWVISFIVHTTVWNHIVTWFVFLLFISTFRTTLLEGKDFAVSFTAGSLSPSTSPTLWRCSDSLNQWVKVFSQMHHFLPSCLCTCWPLGQRPLPTHFRVPLLSCSAKLSYVPWPDSGRVSPQFSQCPVCVPLKALTILFFLLKFHLSH